MNAFLKVLLGVSLIILVGCTNTVLVEKPIYTPIPEPLLAEPEVNPPPVLVYKTGVDETTQLRNQLNAFIDYSRDLLVVIQGMTLNVRTLKRLDAERQALLEP